jgi:topoisomerase IA-like protein
MIRAGAGLGDFNLDDARELVQYAVRRGLISSDEGDQLMFETNAAARGRKGKAKTKRSKAAKKTGGKKSPPKKAARSPKKRRAASRVRKTSKSTRVKRR